METLEQVIKSIEELRGEVGKLRSAISKIESRLENHNKGLHSLRRVQDLYEVTIHEVVEHIWERIRSVESTVFPNLVQDEQSVARIIKPQDWVDPKLPPPPKSE